jgi:hypothetical protein
MVVFAADGAVGSLQQLGKPDRSLFHRKSTNWRLS